LVNQIQWNNASLDECFKNWLADKVVKLFKGFPCIFVNSIWWAHNSGIFKDEALPSEVVAGLVLKIAKEFKLEVKEKKSRIPIMPDLLAGVSWGFFDSASQGHPPRCNVGVVLHFSSSHYVRIKYSPSRGTNTRAEFIGLWTLLEFINKKGIKKVQIFGDSKLVVDWVNRKVSMDDIRLNFLLQDIQQDLNAMEWYSCNHIYRELNSQVDALSKEALALPSGVCRIYESSEGEELVSMEFQL
jgi:ribonuclease HI